MQIVYAFLRQTATGKIATINHDSLNLLCHYANLRSGSKLLILRLRMRAVSSYRRAARSSSNARGLRAGRSSAHSHMSNDQMTGDDTVVSFELNVTSECQMCAYPLLTWEKAQQTLRPCLHCQTQHTDMHGKQAGAQRHNCVAGVGDEAAGALWRNLLQGAVERACTRCASMSQMRSQHRVCVDGWIK